LRDLSRTGLPIVIRDPSTGIHAPMTAYDNRQLQMNFLFTYLPNPGTVIYVGYGTVDQRPDLLGRTSLGPVQCRLHCECARSWHKCHPDIGNRPQGRSDP
jgi:hypothetical protein